MKIFKIVSVNIFGIFIVLIPFILPIQLVKKGFSISKTNNYKEINNNYLKKLSIKTARKMYLHMPFRKIIQYDQNCFSSSEKFVYIPRSNSSCIQNNYEYFVKLNFGKYSNRIDNFGNISNPKIIILGDSHGMGWGVSEENIFTSEINNNGFRSLNLSVSSFGTARELIRFKEWSTKNASKAREIETIIIQYCDNDLIENKAFLNKKSSFENPSDLRLNQYKKNLGKENKYHIAYGGKINQKFYPQVIKKFYSSLYNKIKWKLIYILYPSREYLDITKEKGEHVITFFRVLDNFSDLLKDKKLIIFVSNAYGYGNKKISQEFKKYLDTNVNDNFKSLDIMPTSETFLHANSDSYFIIDDHISELGHKRLGKAILNRLNKQKKLRAQNAKNES